MRRTTIKDVAREAGVSISTVSNALNHVGVISEKTRAHVMEVADRMHYVPNSNGQNLRAQEKKVIGMFLHELSGPYYGELVDRMHRECQRLGYELYIFIVNSDETILQKTMSGEVCAAVLFCHVEEKTLHRLNNAGFPVALLNYDYTDEHICSVPFNSFHAGETAGNYLIGLNHKRLMHVRGLEDNFDTVYREAGLRSAMEKAGLQLEEDYCIQGQFSRGVAYQSMKDFLRSGKPLPDAIFAANDRSAFGCIEALREEGVCVPEDVSIIGCDDIDICELYTPALTTIRTNFEKQGEIAIRELLNLLTGKSKGQVHEIDCQLVIRKSCAARI